MQLSYLQSDNFRLLAATRIEPHSRLNLILGDNASGKTSLLELIYCLSRKRSFRTSSAGDLAGSKGRYWHAAGRFETHEAQAGNRVKLNWVPGELALNSDGDLSLAELSRRFPIQLLEPGLHRLLEEGPAYRRRFLDWGVFHVEHKFFPAWQRYQRALRQRNRALKNGSGDARAFEPELAAAGELVQSLRAESIAALKAPLATRVAQLLGPVDWSLELLPGWNPELGLARSLEEHRLRDQRYGQTVEGPHRAELRLRLNGAKARHRVSRGQQKMLIAALVMAQCDEVLRCTGTSPILLVDDLVAELGQAYQQALVGALSDYKGQSFVTALERSAVIDDLAAGEMFHVEQGTVKSTAAVPRTAQ